MEDVLVEYSIPHLGLKEGEHKYEFLVKSSFFEAFEFFEFGEVAVNVDLTLVKQANMMQLIFDMKGSVELPCDRCGELYHQEIESENSLIVKYSDTEEDTDEIIFLPTDSARVDVSQSVYEFIQLALPVSRIHPDTEDGEPGCDPEMLDRLDQLSGGAEEEDTSDYVDPRWEKLKNLNKE